MKENNICLPLAQLFESDSKKLFKYDIDKNLIYVNTYDKENTKNHEILFTELQNITSKLHEVNCNYSVDTNGDIILNCTDENTICTIKCDI